MNSAELVELWDAAVNIWAFCTFRNPSDPDVSITLYEVQTESDDYWMLVESGHKCPSRNLDAYTRPFGWSDGAKPPMSAVMDIVWERFGLNP